MYTQDWSRVEGSVRAILFLDSRRFDSLIEAVKYYYYARPYGRAAPRYLVDEHDIVIPAWKIAEVVQSLPAVDERRWWRMRHPHVFRQGPVPNLFTRRWRRRCYRAMRTQAEIRENDFLHYDEDALEYGITARPARRRPSLPTSWDDRSFRRERGWKSNRRRQYKE